MNQYYITGRSGDTTIYNGNTPIYNQGGGVFLAKFDQNRNLLWFVNQQSQNYSSYSQAITIDNQGNPIFGGWYEQPIIFDNDTLSVADGGIQNPFIAKFQPDGTYLWSKRVHTPGIFSSGQITSLSTDAQGNIYFGGVFGGTLIFGQDTIQTWGYGDNFWGKMDASGNILWVKAAGGDLIEKGVSVDAGPSGNLYVFGSVASNQTNQTYVDDSLNFQGGFITKYNSTGQMQWLKGAQKGRFYDGPTAYEGTIDAKNGKIVVTGEMFVENDTIEIADTQLVIPNQNENDGIGFALMLDENGNGIWLNEVIKSTFGAQGLAVALKNNGNIILTASTGAIAIIPNTQDTIINGYYSDFYFRLNGQTGQVMDYCYPPQPNVGYGAGSSYRASSISIAGDIILSTGYFTNELNGIKKIFIATINPNILDIPKQKKENPNLMIYPNPSEGIFYLKVSDNSHINNLDIFKITGKQIPFHHPDLSMQSHPYSLNLSYLQPGVYFMILYFDNNITVKKIIVK